MSGDHHAEIVALEAALDGQLVDRRRVERFEPVWLAAGKAWSSAVWEAAVALGPVIPDAATLGRGLDLAARPIFVCGAHRSGTTMLRDLLDGHPALAVLPAEASFFGNMQPHMARLPAGEAASLTGQEWLRRLVNPINQPPFWLLGRSTPKQSPYVDFARALLGWLGQARTPSWPFCAVALAYSGARPDIVRWVEKTPGTERHLKAIWREFPEAKVIHVIRDPASVTASYRGLIGRANRDAAPLTRALRDLAASYRIAARLRRSASPERYRVVRYDDLVLQREGVMAELAVFLGIAPDLALLHPTIAGLPATKNSSSEARDALPPLGPVERLLLTLATASYRRIPD